MMHRREKTVFRRHEPLFEASTGSGCTKSGPKAFVSKPKLKVENLPGYDDRTMKYRIKVHNDYDTNRTWVLEKTYEELLEFVINLDDDGYDLPISSFPTGAKGGIFYRAVNCCGALPAQPLLSDRQERLEDFFLEMTTIEETWNCRIVQDFFCNADYEVISGPPSTCVPTFVGKSEIQLERQDRAGSLDVDAFANSVLHMADDHFTEDVSLSSFNYHSIKTHSIASAPLLQRVDKKPCYKPPVKFDRDATKKEVLSSRVSEGKTPSRRRSCSDFNDHAAPGGLSFTLERHGRHRPSVRIPLSSDCYERRRRLSNTEQNLNRIEIHDKDSYTVTFRREPLGLHVEPDSYHQAPVVRGFLRGEDDKIQQAEALQFIEPSDRIFAVSGQTTVALDYSDVVNLITAALDGTRFETSEPSITFMREEAFIKTHETYAAGKGTHSLATNEPKVAWNFQW